VGRRKKGCQYRSFYVASPNPGTKVYSDEEDAVGHAQSVDVGHTGRLSPRLRAFKVSPESPPVVTRGLAPREKPTDRNALSVATRLSGGIHPVNPALHKALHKISYIHNNQRD
jgi:hypothetical protein